MKRNGKTTMKARVVREFGQGLVLVAVSGSSVGGVLGIVALASRALGR